MFTACQPSQRGGIIPCLTVLSDSLFSPGDIQTLIVIFFRTSRSPSQHSCQFITASSCQLRQLHRIWHTGAASELDLRVIQGGDKNNPLSKTPPCPLNQCYYVISLKAPTVNSLQTDCPYTERKLVSCPVKHAQTWVHHLGGLSYHLIIPVLCH